MGREIVYCSQCGVRILEKDLAAGRAFTVLDKVFCAECRDQAFSQGGAPAAKPAAAAAAKPPARPAAAKVAPPPSSRPAAPSLRPQPRLAPEGVQPPRRVVHAKNRTPVYIACGVGMLLIVVVIIVVLSSGSTGDPAKAGGGSTADRKDANLTPEQRAAQKLNELQLAAQSSNDPAALLKKLADAEKAILGTPSEEAFRSLRKTLQRKLAEGEAGKKIDEILANAKSIAAGDPEFKRFDAEVRPLIQQAQEMAMSDATGKVAAVENAKKELEEPYERKAQEWFEDKDEKQGNEAKIRVWMRENEFKFALKMLENFPPQLKMSRTWKGKGNALEEECRKGLAKAEGKEVKEWTYFLRLGLQDLERKSYAKAKELLAQAEAAMPKFENPTDEDKRRVAWALYYNFACLHAEVSKKQEGAEKSKSVDLAFEYLKKSAEAGVFALPCKCAIREHQTAKDHWNWDKDLETIRPDPRYAELLEKYAK